jgi:hypothetical protein
MNTTDRSLEQRLADLLAAEAPVRGPDRLPDAVLARTSQRRPRPRWLTLVKESPMTLDRRPSFGSPPLRTAAFLVVAVLVALLAVGTVVAGASLLPRPTGLIPPERGVFTPTGSMTAEHAEGHTATLLPDGRVLIVGGWSSIGPAETWDPVTGTFTPAGDPGGEWYGHTATLLRDGRVLIIGMDRAEIWDPGSLRFAPTGSPLRARQFPTTRLQPDGRVLVVGGTDPGFDVQLTTAEIWDPTTGLFSPTDAPPADACPAGTPLHDGRILVIDVDSSSPSYGEASTCDPVTGRSTPAGSLSAPSSGLTATVLLDGRVLVAGGQEETCTPMPEGTKTASIETAVGSCSDTVLQVAELWDPVTGTFSRTGSLARARSFHTATLLQDGRVLLVGSWSSHGGTDSAEVFELR